MFADMPLFSGLTEVDVSALLKGGTPRNLARNDTLFRHGDAATRFYIVTSGTVRLFRSTPDGQEKTIDLLKAGQSLCEDEIMDACSTHRSSAVAMEDSEVLEFSASWVKTTAATHSAFALNLLSLLSQKLHLATIEAEHQASMSAAQLVACFLQRTCVLHDFNPRGFDLPYSKTVIASRLGMQLETFSRALAKLKDQGIVVEGTHVTIQDVKRIEHYVCASCSISDSCETHRAITIASA